MNLRREEAEQEMGYRWIDKAILEWRLGGGSIREAHTLSRGETRKPI